MPRQILEGIIQNFSLDSFRAFFRAKTEHIGNFRQSSEALSDFNDQSFSDISELGQYDFDSDKLVIIAVKAINDINERSGRNAQYEKAKSILKSLNIYSASIFIFYDNLGNFRFSLIYPEYSGSRRSWNNFRRYTYFVSSEFTNKTFLKQIGDKEFNNINDIKEAFSITAVTDLFYKEFFELFNNIVSESKKINKISDDNEARDFILLFAIRSIFLGFIQKKAWLGGDERFIQNFYKEYKGSNSDKNTFYSRWLSPLFFEALNSPPGRKVAYGNNDFSHETEEKLQMAPFLNGGLFRQKSGYDTRSWIISDEAIEFFYEFLFSHSFTIEENSLEDADLQLNPEFLGIIFERLVNKADGAVYTPRSEVDLMCRLSLVKWLQKNLASSIRVENLYELFFKESDKEEEQKQGSFSQKEAQDILDKLENLAVCDPAVGSGAFLVGMMQVIDGVEQSLRNRYGLYGKSSFERKKQIIKSSLYGVEIKEWAVWICQLRLWLSLFVDAPDDLKNSLEAILPSLDFKVRQGDSLVQRVGTKAFPISGNNITLRKTIKDKITRLKNLKLQYFDNKSTFKIWELKERELAIYEEILREEINDKQKNLRQVKDEKPSIALSLFGDMEPEQTKLSFNLEIVQQHEQEIKELETKLKQLRHGGKPLVWGIEFADVFGEKGGFDIVIGNPPYVRQEDIADPTGKIKDKKEYKGYLEEMVKLDFPDYFSPKTMINAQSDLYTYFYIRSLRLLNPRGIQTFICSNSWLDVGYGVWLQEFLLNRCPIEMIIDNQAKRSFEAADVNTIISIIRAPQATINENHKVKFIAFKEPFEKVVFTENLLAIESANECLSNQQLRVNPIQYKVLKEAGMELNDESQTTMKMGKYVGDKWGVSYITQPDIITKILSKNSFIRLNKIATARFGVHTGLNDFYYPTVENIEKFRIENEYLFPIITSPSQVKSIFLSTGDVTTKLFYCPFSINQLKERNHSGALSYILWAETQKTTKGQKREAGIPWPRVNSIRDRKPGWWSLPNSKLKKSKLFLQYRTRVIFYSVFADKPISSHVCFHNIAQSKYKEELLHAYLNTTLAILFRESYGRKYGGGGGPLESATIDWSRLWVIDNLENLQQPLLLAIDRLTARKPLDIFSECGIDPKLDISIDEQEPKPRSDRAKLDNIIFDTLKLSENERRDVYRALCRLVWNRISKANSV